MRQGDIVSEIKERIDPARYRLGTAEGRADFDDALRAELAQIADAKVRAHAAELLKEWRVEVFPVGRAVR